MTDSGLYWSYLPLGTVTHARSRSDDAGAVCGVYTLPASDWRGRGTQDEYETAAAMKKCAKCMRAVFGRI